LFPSPYRG